MKRESISKEAQYQVFCRDKWHCRYCNDSVFFSPILKILESISPGHGYYHPNGKSDEMLTLFANKFASVDHVNPVTKGGKNTLDNYVTSCWECNLQYGNKSHSEGKPVPNEIYISRGIRWDGLSSLFPKLSNNNDGWTKVINGS